VPSAAVRGARDPISVPVRVSEVDPTKGLDWIEGVAIIVAVVVVVLVTAFNDWSKERQFRGLKRNVDRQHTFCVIRDAQTTQLVVADIVVGDVCVIKYGKDMVTCIKLDKTLS